MTTARLNIGGIPLVVEYEAITDKYAAIDHVSTPDGLDNILRLLSVDCLNTIRVACVRHSREEAAYLARCEQREALEP